MPRCALLTACLLTTLTASAHASPLDEARASSIRCDGPCPPAVAAIVVVTEAATRSESNFCGATLVGPDLLLTAGHCLGVGQFTIGGSCDSVVVLFPASGEHRAERVGCARVEAMTEVTSSRARETDRLDHALLRLERASRRAPIAVSNVGLARDATMTMYVPRDESGRTVGAEYELVLERRECGVALGSVALPGFEREVSGYGLLAPCRVVVGNSGSGVLASDGTVRAVVSAMDNWPSARSVEQSLLTRRGPRAGVSFRVPFFAAVVSSLACANLPGMLEARGSARECAATSYPDVSTLRRAGAQRLARALGQLERDVQRARRATAQWSRTTTGLRWRVRVERGASRIVVRAVPTCRAEEASVRAAAPVHELQARLDDRFRVEVVSLTRSEPMSLVDLPLCRSSRASGSRGSAATSHD